MRREPMAAGLCNMSASIARCKLGRLSIGPVCLKFGDGFPLVSSGSSYSASFLVFGKVFCYWYHKLGLHNLRNKQVKSVREHQGLAGSGRVIVDAFQLEDHN